MADNVLSPRQRRALAALLGGATVAVAAESAGVTTRTLARWRESQAFREALADGQREALAATVRGLTMIARAAVRVLGKTLADESARPADRLRAASVVLERVLPLAELVELEARVAALEAEGAKDDQQA
jgi:hypothetical protein